MLRVYSVKDAKKSSQPKKGSRTMRVPCQNNFVKLGLNKFFCFSNFCVSKGFLEVFATFSPTPNNIFPYQIFWYFSLRWCPPSNHSQDLGFRSFPFPLKNTGFLEGALSRRLRQPYKHLLLLLLETTKGM